ncbi:MAG: BREX system P-loop protein BrxC [Deltaproteobacteria bacterium HGW-Deltaproteobacteria-17]|nr:MAG: BREX system P-loop protein BrxC [Deltaproteobacteria bacterium HGW-Deltaproteobacteria-17]
MKNRDLYQTDPLSRKLVNQGVASLNDERTQLALSVLRYELETFVCDGQYEKGLEHILDTFLKNLNHAQQPAVWVSGFYGSGKSHLVKMLRALWLNTPFEDGAVPRGIAHLPQGIKDLLHELDAQAKKVGGLFAASGTLSAGSKQSVRLALLQILFKSAGLPENYAVARFVLWLEHEGLLDAVRAHVEKHDHDWQGELKNLYVAVGLREALMAVMPNRFNSLAECGGALRNQFPPKVDLSSEELLSTIREVLLRANGGKGKHLPLTLIAIDEVQQYIGDSSERSLDVQELVESVSKNLGGRVLFVGTGQTAVTGTANLARLQGRFTVRVELSDADVDSVIRKVILAKKPEAVESIEKVMQANLGEISRHLANSTLRHRQDDVKLFPQDYPILPVRRRFWEHALRALDRSGTDSQLRNQLSMVHKVVGANVEQPLGTVIPADVLFFDSADKLLQSKILPRRVHEITMTWNQGSEDQRLMARACGLIFLINKLNGSHQELGLRATADVLADLLVEDLTAGSSGLRTRLDALLPACELVMRIKDEYVIQTQEFVAWNDEFLSECGVLQNAAHRIESLRDDQLKEAFSSIVNKLNLLQGQSKEKRELVLHFDSELPSDADSRLILWVRHGWNADENRVRSEAQQAGPHSPTVFAFIPKRSADELRQSIIHWKAARTVLDRRHTTTGEETQEARAAMETRSSISEARLKELIQEAISGVRVFKGGGEEVTAGSPMETIQEAAKSALDRLYHKFTVADHAGWPKVLEKAQKGVGDALRVLGHEGEPASHPVCKAIREYLAQPRRGSEIARHFQAPPMGWSRDAIDGALMVLLVPGSIRAESESRHPITDVAHLERKAIGKTTFKTESITVTLQQRFQVRGLFGKLEIPYKKDEESAAVGPFMAALRALAEAAGGEPPRPRRPDTSLVDRLDRLAGNEQLVELAAAHDELVAWIDTQQALAGKIGQKLPGWEQLRRLQQHAKTLPQTVGITESMQGIEARRALLDEPDPVAALLLQLTQVLRTALNELFAKYQEEFDRVQAQLADDPNWRQLTEAQQDELREAHSLSEDRLAPPEVGDSARVLATLDRLPLSTFSAQVAALAGRCDAVRMAAAKLCEPEVQVVTLNRKSIRSAAELDAWLNATRIQVQEVLEKGHPVMLK